MEEYQVEIKKAIDENDVNKIRQVLKKYGAAWLETCFLPMGPEFMLATTANWKHKSPPAGGSLRFESVGVEHKCPGYKATPLYYAVTQNAYDAVVALINAGAAVNQFGNWKDTALHRAVYLAFYDIVKFLVASGADIDQQQKEQIDLTDFTHRYTPLHFTVHVLRGVEYQINPEEKVRSIRAKIAKFLLNMEASTKLIDDRKETIIQAAERNARQEIIRAVNLNAEGAERNIKVYKGLGIGKPGMDKSKVNKMIQKEPKKFLSILRHEWQLNKWQYALVTRIFSKTTEVAALLKPLVGKQLTTLDLSNKGIDDTTIKMVVWLLQQNCFLRQLDLQNNNITTEGLKLLSTAIAEHPQLELINIRNNSDITHSGIDDFITTVNSNYRLLEIYLPSHANSEQKDKAIVLCSRNEALAKQLRDYAKAGNVVGVQQLVLQGANVHYKQDTALIQATENFCIEVVKVLLMNGANPYVVGTGGLSAYQIAVDLSDPATKPSHYENYIKILSLMESHDYIRLQLARINVVNQASDLNVPITQLLAQFGTFVPSSSKTAEVPLSSAIPNGPG